MKVTHIQDESTTETTRKSARWFKSVKNRDISTGPTTCPFAHLPPLLNPLPRFTLFALLVRSTALTYSLARSTFLSQARGKVLFLMSHVDLIVEALLNESDLFAHFLTPCARTPPVCKLARSFSRLLCLLIGFLIHSLSRK